jgi:hypothetical protein
MHFHTAKVHLEQIDALVRRRATGTPDQMAQKLGIGRATWFEWLEQLRADLGLPIAYDTAARTYYYARPGHLICRFVEDCPAQFTDLPANPQENSF